MPTQPEGELVRLWALGLVRLIAVVLVGIVAGYMRGPWLSLGLAALARIVFSAARLLCLIAVVMVTYVTLPLLGVSRCASSVNSRLDLFAVHIGGSLPRF